LSVKVKGSEEKVSNQIVQFIRRQVNTRKADCVVIGISGGLDSAVAASLAVRALGPDKFSDWYCLTPPLHLRRIQDMLWTWSNN